MKVAPWFVPVGGFLGAGKTTLLLTAGRMLSDAGLKVAMILNDQAESLVDTAFVSQNGFTANEVAGGCFCCRFSDLLARTEELRQQAPDVIFAEPVGSCVDLAATVIRPLLRDFSNVLRLAPLSVVVDPAQARKVLAGHTDEHTRFLFERQIEEADLICYSKMDEDKQSHALSLPVTAPVYYMSGKTGEGVGPWLKDIVAGSLPCGAVDMTVDYGRYAEAEASLAWLNWSFTFEADQPISPALLLGPLFDDILTELDRAHIGVAHFKALAQCATGYIKVSATRSDGQPDIEGALDASPAMQHLVRLNLRAADDPVLVEQLVVKEVAKLPGRRLFENRQCFRPSPPTPERHLRAGA